MRSRFLVFLALVFLPRAAWSQGNPVGPEFRINTYTTSGQGGPEVASDASGGFVVIWGGAGTGDLSGIFGQRYASGGMPLGTEFRVNTYTTDAAYPASVASEPSGNFVVVWSRGLFPAGVNVFGQRYDSSGTPLGIEFRVNTAPPGISAIPSVAASAGSFLVVWDTPFGLFDVFGQRYDGSGVPLGPEFRVNTYTQSMQRWPAAAADAVGNFVVVWQSSGQDGSSYGVFGQRYSSSGTLIGPEFRVNTFTTGDQVFPGVAADPAGNFVVVWEDRLQEGSGSGVFGQRYAASGMPQGPEFRVNTFTKNDQALPKVACDTAGNFVITWMSYRQDDPLSWGIFGQRYGSSGSPLGPEFRVNTYTTNLQGIPAIASDGAGNFVVVWESYYQDGSYSGVFGQRFSQIVPVELMQFGVE